jgi:hypothetical protein
MKPKPKNAISAMANAATGISIIHMISQDNLVLLRLGLVCMC